MSQSLSVDLNRSRLYEIGAPERITTDSSFTIDLANHGEAVHIHLHLDDELSNVAKLDVGNHYVEADSEKTVHVNVRAVEETVRGRLKIATGYGAETRYVTIVVEPGSTSTDSVDVDESLGKPRQRTSTPASSSLNSQFGGSGSGSDSNLLPVVGVGMLAIVVALGIGAVVDSVVVFIGVGVVIGGVIAAVAMQLTRGG